MISTVTLQRCNAPRGFPLKLNFAPLKEKYFFLTRAQNFPN